MSSSPQAPPAQSHRTSVKSGSHHHDDAADRRRGAATDIRKERRQEQVGKRRKGLSHGLLRRTESEILQDSADAPPFPASDEEVNALLQQLRALASSPAASRTAALAQLKTLLSHPSAPVTLFVSLGVVDVLLDELRASASLSSAAAANAVEAVWCLVNIAADGYDNTLRVLPASPLLISLLGQHSHPELQELAAWTLGNLAGDDHGTRDALLQQGVVLPLVQLYCHQHTAAAAASSSSHSLPLLRIVSWALSNVFKSRLVQHQPVLAASVTGSSSFLSLCFTDWTGADHDVAVEVSWLLYHLASHGDAVLQQMLQQGLVEALRSKIAALQQDDTQTQQQQQTAEALQVEGEMSGEMRMEHTASGSAHELSLPSTTMPAATHIPIIRIIANIAALPASPVAALFTPASPTTPAVPASSLPPVLLLLRAALSSTHRGLRKEAAWAVSNLASTGQALILSSVVQAQLTPLLLSMLHHAAYDEQKQAAFALYHIAAFDLSAVLREGRRDSIRGFLHLLQVGDADACLLSLRMLPLILQQGRDAVEEVEEAGGIDALERTMTMDGEMWRLAQSIIDRYWGDDEQDGEAQSVSGQQATDGGQQRMTEADIPPWRLQAMRNAQQLLEAQSGSRPQQQQ